MKIGGIILMDEFVRIIVLTFKILIVGFVIGIIGIETCITIIECKKKRGDRRSEEELEQGFPQDQDKESG
jgi:hypothetical protein